MAAAYARVRAPDLDRMQRFLTDFGLEVGERTSDRLTMRSAESGYVAHVTERGDPQHVGFALTADSLADLATLAAETGATVRERTEVGGGHALTLVDPTGLEVEVVHGLRAKAAERGHDQAASAPKGRRNEPIRLNPRPSRVLRLGHVALFTPKLEASIAFYCERLGMKVTDTYLDERGTDRVGVFLRCGLGARFTDHHTIALIGAPVARFDHIAFEVDSLDEVMIGKAFLESQNAYVHSWGVGRHVEGSQIFDYWRDPFGTKVEHWTDGDLVNDDYPSRQVRFTPAGLSQWGPPLGKDFLS
jgi:catechol 2,3-dioxygenase-like lactoylglutathione lyase family enzyme